MLGANYLSKKALKDSIGKPLQYIETSMLGHEYRATGRFAVVGPCPYTNRKWFAEVTMHEGKITKVD